MPNLKPFKIITHQDLDGGASAIVVINYLKRKYKKVQYSIAFKTYSNVDIYVEQIFNIADQFEHIFITDISIAEYLAKEMPSNCTIYDHHDSAEHLTQFNNCIVDTSGKHCGATLCYELLMKNNGYRDEHIEKLVKIAEDYDNWKLKLPYNVGKNLNFIYYSLWGDKFVERFMNGFDKFSDSEKTFLKEKWKTIKEEIERTQLIDLLEDDPNNKNKICSFIIEDKSEVNEICESLLKEKGYKIVLAISSKNKKMSIRSTDEVFTKGLHIGHFNEELSRGDLRGGGHPKAGGISYGDMDHLQFICQSYADKIIELGL